MKRPFSNFLVFITGLTLSTLACGVIGSVENPTSLNGVAYWAAQTATPIPTVTIFLGMSTPVYPDTPIPNPITTTPEWTTVTATPFPPPETATPPGFIATPYWVTTTPLWITETPVPPWTTTPSLPMIGFTTPTPLETPYYRVGTFYLHSDVYIGSPNSLVFRLINHETQPSPHDEAATYHYLTLLVKNYTDVEAIVPASDLFFIRRVTANTEDAIVARWVTQNEPLIARGLPGYETQQLTPLAPGTEREFVLGFVLPNGTVNEVGLITDWERPVEGGLPVWFYLQNDPLGPLTDAYQPPPPTSVLLDDIGTQGGGNQGGQPGGSGLWPTTGTITRGFGCDDLYTGIDGAGFGCPPDLPWFHNGVDIANSQGTVIWSPVDGTMFYAGPNNTGPDCSDIPGSQPPHKGLGNYQRVGDGNTLHYFGHLSDFLLTSGPVTAGQLVAEMGSTGCSTGSHLHWIVYQGGNLVDPALWAGPGPNP